MSQKNIYIPCTCNVVAGNRNHAKGTATHSPQRQRGEGLDGGDGMRPRGQPIPTIQALPPLALGGVGGGALTPPMQRSPNH